jgi:hypothetical protein
MISGEVPAVCMRLPARSRAASRSRCARLKMTEDPAHERVAHDATQPLVAHVVGAEHVAVHQQHALAVEFDYCAVARAACSPYRDRSARPA